MLGGGNLVRCERYRKTPRTPRSSHARYYYTRSLVLDTRNRPRQQRLRCQSAPKVMDRSHSRSASPREPSRPQHRPPSPPSPPAAFDNRAYEHDDYDPNHNDSFDSNGPNHNGHTKEVNGDTKTLEAVNLELINLTPKNGSAKQRKDVEVDMNTNNPYDEYFVPVNEHRKYMRGEKLYVTADKRGEKGGCKRPLCWTLLGLVVAAIVALIVLAATGILFTNSPTPLEPYNASVSSARALGGIGNVMSNDQNHDHDQDHDSDQVNDDNHSHDHGHDHGNNEQNVESEQYGEHDQTTEHGNNQDQENSQEDMSRENQEILRTQYRTTAPSIGEQGPQMQNDEGNDPSSASEEVGDKSIYVPRTIEGELKIDNDEFTAALEDPESDEYRDFVTAFGDALKQVLFDKNNLEYNENDIALEIIKIRRGSIIITYRIHWDPKYNTQASDNLLTPNSLKDNLDFYLAQNNRMISIYHIAEDKLSTRLILDICQINKNGCDYGCQFDKRTLDFTCTCPPGQIIDMKQPKKCMLLLDSQDQANNKTKVNIFSPDLSTVTANPDAEKEQPNTESIYGKQTPPPLSETTTENDADVNFSHIFGSSFDEHVEHVTEMSKHQPESSDETYNIATHYVNFLETTLHPYYKNNKPVPEPEPTSEPQPDSKTTVAIDSLESKPTRMPEFTRSSEPQPTPEPTTDSSLYQTTETKTKFAEEKGSFDESKKMRNNIDVSNTENLSTTEAPSFTHHGHMYTNKFDSTTIPSEIDTTQTTSVSEKYGQEKTTTENEWLEDSSEKSHTSKSENSYTEHNSLENNERATEERSSKSYENEFVDETSREPTTLRDTDKEVDSNTRSSITRDRMNDEDHTTNAVSISEFLGKKSGEETTVKNLLDSTASVLTGIEESRPYFSNETTDSVISGETTPSQISLFGSTSGSSTISERIEATTSAFETSTEYSIAKQTKDVHMLDPNFMTILQNTNNSQPDNNLSSNMTTEKDFVDGDITFDAINKLYNRSSKSFVNDKGNVAIGTEVNDMYKETTETTTSADWLSETVTEINYQDIIDENKNRLTTETSATKLDEIMSRGSNRDDFEPDYLNMGSNTTKGIEHDMPQYGMLHDYDSEDLVIKRVKNAPDAMIDETTVMNAVQITSKENQMEELSPIPTAETNNTFETTTIADYIYKITLNESNQNLNSTVSTTQPVPQVWENPEDDMIFNIKNVATPMMTDAISDITTTTSAATTTLDYVEKSNNDSIVNASESNMQTNNVSQANNLNVNIYEISSHTNNDTIEKSVNHQATEYVDHETEMNPFLPETENNKNLVKKLQEGHDLEPSNVNETQNDNTEEQLHRLLDESMAVNNQTAINGSVFASSKNTTLAAKDNEAMMKEMLMQQDTSSNEERSRKSGQQNKEVETTPSVNDLVDNTKDSSVSNDAIPITTFLLDTDDLDSTKDPFDKENVNSGLIGNSETTMMSIINTLPENTTDNKINDDNELLSVVPIEPEIIFGQDNLKKNYDGENIPELNQISDSPKKSDRRTLDSDTINSLIDNEA